MAEIHEIAEVAHKPAWKLIDPDRPTEGYRCVHEGSAGVCGQLIYRLTHAAPVHVTRVKVERPQGPPDGLAESLVKALNDNERLREQVVAAEALGFQNGFAAVRLMPDAIRGRRLMKTVEELEAAIKRVRDWARTTTSNDDDSSWDRGWKAAVHCMLEALDNAPDDSADLDRLRRHLLSTHCLGNALNLSDREALQTHELEHRGPGGIRDHDIDDWSWDFDKGVKVLAEAAEMDGTP
jgi:hypothetical protein